MGQPWQQGEGGTQTDPAPRGLTGQAAQQEEVLGQGRGEVEEAHESEEIQPKDLQMNLFALIFALYFISLRLVSSLCKNYS